MKNNKLTPANKALLSSLTDILYNYVNTGSFRNTLEQEKFSSQWVGLSPHQQNQIHQSVAFDTLAQCSWFFIGEANKHWKTTVIAGLLCACVSATAAYSLSSSIPKSIGAALSGFFAGSSVSFSHYRNQSEVRNAIRSERLNAIANVSRVYQ